MTPEHKLSLAASELVNNEGGKKFIAALEEYVEELREACIQASPDKLQNTQGRAWAGSKLLQLIKDSPGVAEKLRTTEENRKLRSK